MFCFLLIQQSVSIIGIDLSLIPSVGLCVSVSLCVWKVYCGKVADWIRMPFGVVSWIGWWTDVLDGSDDCRRGKAVLVVNLEHHCNEWGTLLHVSARVMRSSQLLWEDLLYYFSVTGVLEVNVLSSIHTRCSETAPHYYVNAALDCYPR